MRDNMHKNSLQWSIVTVSIILQALLLVIQLQCVTFADVNVIREWLSGSNLPYIGYGMLLYIVFLLGIYNLTGRILPGYIGMEIFTMLFGAINNMKWNALNECVTLSDLSKLS